MSSLPPDLDVGSDEPLDKARWDRAMSWIAAKIRAHDAFQPSWVAAVNELRTFGLARLNDAVQPVYDRLTAIAQIGALFTATSTSNVVVSVGVKVFDVVEVDRARFAATSYLAIRSIDDPALAMLGSLQGYDRSTGLLTVLVEHVVGIGSSASWSVMPGMPPALAFVDGGSFS